MVNPWVFKVLAILWMFSDPCTCMHTTFCFRLPQDKILHNDSYAVNGEIDVASPGIEKFPKDIWGKYAVSYEGDFNDGSSLPSGKSLFQNFVDSKQSGGLELVVSPIYGRPRGQEPLTGWFHIQVSLTAQNAFTRYVKSFILFATDEQFNFVGTFEYDAFPPDAAHNSECPPTHATKHMIIPCGGVSKYEPFASNAVLFVRNSTDTDDLNAPKFPDKYKQYWPIVPAYPDAYDLNFYYKFSMQTLNRNFGDNLPTYEYESRLIFRVIADPDVTYDKIDDEGEVPIKREVEKHLLSAYAYITVKGGSIPGAADALPTNRGSVSCSNAMKARDRNNQNILGPYWPWYVFKFFPNAEEERATDNSIAQGGFDGLPVVHSYYILSKTGCTAKFFGGRCEDTFCSLTNKNPGGLKDPLTKRNKANFSLIPQVKSLKTIAGTNGVRGICKCDGGYTRGNCFHEQPDIPKRFNNEDTQFPNCLDYYKSLVTGDRCNKTAAQVISTRINVIRRNNYNRTSIIYEKQNVTDLGVVGAQRRQTKRAVDRRGVRMLGFGTILYSVRKGHGIMMLLMTFFCIPVSIFVSRYYKESFMAKRILYARVWLQIHIQLVFWMVVFCIAGILIALVGRGFIGVSLHPYGLMHRIFGWVTFALLIVVACSGGIRVYNEKGRKGTIIAHWALGYILYTSAMLSVISSIHVPGSPIAKYDKSVDSSEAIGDLKGNISPIYFAVTFWLVYELVFHVTMNFLLHTYDRWMQVDEPRLYLPALIGVPIPVLRENSEEDASGSGVRLIAFWIYIGIAALVALLTSGLVAKEMPNVDKGFGPMTCTHVYNDSLDYDEYDGVKYEFRKAIDPDCYYHSAK